MSLRDELGLQQPIHNRPHEAMMNLVLTGAMLVKEGSKILQPFKLTDSQFNVLMLLKYQSNGAGLTQTALGNMLLVNRSNVTGLIDRLEQAGLVERAADTGDRRINMVLLTSAGQEVLDRAEEVYRKRVEEVMSELHPLNCLA